MNLMHKVFNYANTNIEVLVMKNVMSVIGTGMLMMGAGYGAYRFVCDNKSKMMKTMKKKMKQSPYTSSSGN